MRILITGGSGLIGRALTADLAAGGEHEVVVLSRRPETVAGLPPGARAEGWDARTPEGWGALVDGDTAIVNLAGENIAGGRWSAERKRRIRDSRVHAAGAVVAAVAAAAVKPRVVVQASAVGYYGDRGAEKLTEDSAPGDDFLAEVCVTWETASVPLVEMGVRRPLLRTGVVLATEGGALPRMLPPFRFFVGGPLGGGEQYFPWIHIADEIAAIRFLLESEDADGPFNLTAPNPVTNREFSRALGRTLGRPSFLPAPAFALRLLLGEMADLLLEGQRALPRALAEAGFRFRFPTPRAALEDLVG